MRPLLIFAMLAALVRVGHAQDAPRPVDVFRGRVDLITIDVSALDARGKPVEDLRDRDFTVKINGKVRPLVSAELIKVDRARTLPSVRPADALISTNATTPDARRIVLAVDQTLITPGAITPLLRTAAQFVDRLTPSDYAAFIGFPEPGPRVDFTSDRAKVRKAMEGIVGQPAKRGDRKFNIALWEGLALDGGERPFASSANPNFTSSDPVEQVRQLLESLMEPQTMRRIFERGCEDHSFDELLPSRDEIARMLKEEPDKIKELLERVKRCRTMIFQEAMTIVSDARQEAQLSLRALEALLKDLALIDGPKTMVVMSAGLVNDNPSVLNEVAELAAAARTTINVIAVDRERDQEVRMSFGASQAGGTLIDRSYEMQGLEIIADATGGKLYRSVGGTSEGVFQRIESELSAWYLLAVERQPGDPERQRVNVEVKRKGVEVRSNKTFVSTAAVNARRAMEEVLRDALSSSLAVPGIPLRVATFAQRDTAPGRYRLRLAAQIGQPGEKPGEFAVGYALMGENGRPVTTAGSRRTLSPAASGPNQTLQYDTALSVAPGSYVLRFGVVDKDGRRGTVAHRLELPKLDENELSTSDLIVGNLPAEGESLTPRIEPQITTSEVAGYLELYLPPSGATNVSVVLEIAEGEGSPALAKEMLTLRPAENPSWRVATGFVAATIAPGRYLARAAIQRDGVLVKTVSRPFTIVRDPTVVSRPTTRSRGVPITPELKYRTGTYIAGVVNGLANVVAQEDFVLSKPDRRVTSDLALVGYPGSQRDLIPHRDVLQVNGASVAREERLLDLFVKPSDSSRERARRIMSSAEAHVPSAFSPVWVLGFLQADFQSRFELTVNDAGSDWPREVKAVTFVEIGRPTLLRTGAFGDLDVPTRGTAWIEEGTGRILQTELEVGRGKSTPSMVTKFRLDDKLQVMVPVEMRVKNPDGVATYSNFRRFEVATDTVIPTPPPTSPAPSQR